MQAFKNILCVMTPDPESGTALQRAAALAGNNQAELTVVELIEDLEPSGDMLDSDLISADLQHRHMAAHQQALDRRIAGLSENIEVRAKVLSGISFIEIIRQVLRHGYDLVIKIPENGGLMDRVFGSDDMHLLRKCPCPVWLVKPQASESYRRIVAPVDVDDFYPADEQATRHALNLQVLEIASSLAVSEFASLHVVAVWRARYEGVMQGGFMNMPDNKVKAYVKGVRQQYGENMDQLMAEVTGKVGQAVDYIKPEVHIVKGWPREVIPVFTKNIEADLVVMGTVSRTGIPGFFMGNTAETILNRLDCSVLAIKPPGFVSPISLGD